MKNIYHDNDEPQKGENITSGSFEFEDIDVKPSKASDTAPPPIQRSKVQPQKQAVKPVQESAQQPIEQPMQQPIQQPMQQPMQQPIQQPMQPGQQPTQQAYYYAPMPMFNPFYQPGIPIQLTPEQIAVLQQYAVPPQYGAPPQYAAPQQPSGNAADPGTRVLYQSEDFDKPVHKPEPKEEYEDFSDFEETSEEEAPTQAFYTQDAPTEEETLTAENFTAEDIPIEIEEETISMTPPKEPDPPKTTLKIEEMEMSTFELNSMLIRKNPGQAKAYTQQTQQTHGPQIRNSGDVPLNSAGSFDIEETVNEIASDTVSDKKAKANKKKKLPVSEIIRRVILGVSALAIVISAAMLLNEYRLSKENDNLEEGVSDLILSVADKTTTKENNKETTEAEESTTVALTPEQQWAEIQAEYPNLIFPQGLQLKYAKLYATNNDFVGYLEAKGVNLSLPVVQTDDDKDYMRKNFYGKSTKYGCPFVTSLNNIVELDLNTVIFGHHMNNGTVFGALDAYKTIDGFKSAPLITFNTLYKDYSWKVIAAFITNAYPKEDNGYVFRYYFTSLSTEDRFAAFLNELSQRSLYDTGVDVLPTDKLLTLSTCSHEFNEARFVVVARLVRNGESTEVDVSKATVNPSPRYPQAYYNKKKLTNPYKDATRWEVG